MQYHVARSKYQAETSMAIVTLLAKMISLYATLYQTSFLPTSMKDIPLLSHQTFAP